MRRRIVRKIATLGRRNSGKTVPSFTCICQPSIASFSTSTSSPSSSFQDPPSVTPTAHPQQRMTTASSVGGISSASSISSSTTTKTSSSSAASSSSSAWASTHAQSHTALSPLQRSLVFAGSSLLALLNPHRGDLVAAVGEVSPLTTQALVRLRDSMLATADGRWLLEHKPRIDSTTFNVAHMLRTLPVGSFGHSYALFMSSHHYLPDDRSMVRFISDPTLAYILQRYRETHDLLHVLSGLPTTVLGELGQKAVESLHYKIPMTTLSATMAPPLTLSPRDSLFYYSTLLPWARRIASKLEEKKIELIALRFEEMMGRNLEEVRRELGIEQIDKEVFVKR